MPLLDGQVHHDTHAVPKGNYVIAVGISLIVSPSEVGNCVIADKRVRPSAAYFAAGHRLLDSLTRTPPARVPTQQRPDHGNMHVSRAHGRD